jgi:hypothetical protein
MTTSTPGNTNDGMIAVVVLPCVEGTNDIEMIVVCLEPTSIIGSLGEDDVQYEHNDSIFA